MVLHRTEPLGKVRSKQMLAKKKETSHFLLSSQFYARKPYISQCQQLAKETN